MSVPNSLSSEITQMKKDINYKTLESNFKNYYNSWNLQHKDAIQ